MKKIKGYITLAAVMGLFGYVGFKIFSRVLRDHLLKTEAVKIRAVIIDDVIYSGNSPVSQDHAYSFMFVVDGESYTGNSNNSKLKPGDSIEVVYVKSSPRLNKSLNPE
jgi:hypothetical protein